MSSPPVLTKQATADEFYEALPDSEAHTRHLEAFTSDKMQELEQKMLSLEEKEKKIKEKYCDLAMEKAIKDGTDYVNPVSGKILRRMTLQKIDAELAKRPNYYAREHEANNDSLFLNGNKFETIENLKKFVNLKVLYLNDNRLTYISGLEKLTNLKSLHLQGNLIKEINGLQELKKLAVLNLASNLIERINNLDHCISLEHLNLAQNKVGLNGLSDIEGIKHLTSLTSLDLSGNHVEVSSSQQDKFFEIFKELTELGALYLTNNPVSKNMPRYRKTVLCRLPSLKHLDTDIVRDYERRFALAYEKGGVEAVDNEKRIYAQECKSTRKAQTSYLQEMLKNKDKLLKETYKRLDHEYEESLKELPTHPKPSEVETDYRRPDPEVLAREKAAEERHRLGSGSSDHQTKK